jgi:hypothetical protein
VRDRDREEGGRERVFDSMRGAKRKIERWGREGVCESVKWRESEIGGAGTERVRGREGRDKRGVERDKYKKGGEWGRYG